MNKFPLRCSTLLLFTVAFHMEAAPVTNNTNGRMSGMGQLAQDKIKAAAVRAIQLLEVDLGQDSCADGHRACSPNSPTVTVGGTQSEVTIAVDSTAQHVVIGFNDARGFARNPVSLSGFMYSDDGGQTFKDGGQLPSPGNQVLGSDRFPQIFGDPDVKYLGGCNFIYSSLLVKVAGAGLAQTLGIHKSTDCGHSWTGPIEVTPATNPNGRVDVNGNAVDSADKEQMDVDPDTGRVLLGWSNFTPVAAGGVEISTTWTDNILAASPTFAPRSVIAATVPDGQAATVRFAGNGSSNAYISWVRYPGFFVRQMAFARSTDNGLTWSAPVNITSNFVGMDEVLGNDRVNEFPSLAVDNSPGPFKGNVYVVYSNNNSRDQGDIVFQKSINGSVSFTAPTVVNSRPGADRAQWFPVVAADSTTGRVTIFYYDQGIDTSGDLTEVSYLYSDDGGTTWSRPAPLSDRPFKAGWGNDTFQPNLGDYNQGVAQLGMFYGAFATTAPQLFTDGQPSTQLITPDVDFAKVLAGQLKLPLRLGAVTFTDSGGDGSLDPGETAKFRLVLSNNDTNPLHASSVSGITAILSSPTPGVTITQASSAYPNLAPGAAAQNTTEYSLTLSQAFLPGTPIELRLAVTAASGTTELRYTQPTGTLLKTTLLTENFDGVPPGTLPAGWVAAHGAGGNTVPWSTVNTFCGSSNKAFHPNANDGTGPNANTRWERLFSPQLTIPGDSQSVEVEFDVCYDTEDDPNFRVLAYDGFFLRITDLTAGRTLRSVLAEAFEEEFTTGAIKHYPKHFPRNDDPSYFEDMSAWAGDSGGVQHVRMKLPGMAGSRVQFRFEYAQDLNGTCADIRPGHTCGVSIDNFVVRSVRAVKPSAVELVVRPQLTRDAGGNIVAQIAVTNNGTAPAANVRLSSAVLGSTATNTTPLPLLGVIAPGATATASITFPPSAGVTGAASILRVTGTYDGGTFTSSTRVVIP